MAIRDGRNLYNKSAQQGSNRQDTTNRNNREQVKQAHGSGLHTGLKRAKNLTGK